LQIERFLILFMGRIAGGSAEQTRERLLSAAADVFGERGYEGTRVVDIAEAAGVSNGALYAHFGSKAELLSAALRAHGGRLLEDLRAAQPESSMSELLEIAGRMLLHHRAAGGYLVIEALVAAHRDQEVAEATSAHTAQSAAWLAGLMDLAKAEGELDSALSSGALAHFCLVLAMGSALVTPEMHPVGEQEWDALTARVVAALTPTGDVSAEE
jgi:AcrR family transcriptional regulator